MGRVVGALKMRVTSGRNSRFARPGWPTRVLIVSLSGYQAEILRDADWTGGLEIEQVGNAQQALERLRGGFYHVVIIDLASAQASPIEFYQAVGDFDLGQAERVVFLAHDLADTDTRRFLTAAGRPFLTQPVDPGMLLDLVLRVSRGEVAS